MKNIKIIIFLIFILNNIQIKSDDSLKEKFFFQLYPSNDDEKPYIFHVYTPTKNFLTINSTEGKNCKIIEDKLVDEYPIIGLSSAHSFNDTFLIKTCFGPNKIVEIINKKKQVFIHKNNYNLANVKFCYTTSILDPLTKRDTIIMTYWTEFTIKKGEEKYTHKSIFFYPKTQKFSGVFYLTLDANFLEKLFINYNFYPKSCITFRSVDIYCSINLNSETSFGNSFLLDTSKIQTSDAQIHKVISTTDYGSGVNQKPIEIGKQIHDAFGGYFDAFLTEYHDEQQDKTVLVSSLFRKTIHTTFVSISDRSMTYHGVNIEDSYINPNLFNYLIPNENDLIIIYLMQTRDSMGLIMTRYNLTNSVSMHMKFQEYSLSNYLLEGICPMPKYIQSIFATTFINYTNKDKSIIQQNGSQNYYKYQTDIVTFISCEENNGKVSYQSKKITMPQCLNDLDVLNNKNIHTLKYTADIDNIMIDIYNDPKYISLRNCTIEFFPVYLKANNPIIIRIKEENSDYRVIKYNETNILKNLTHIHIFRTINFYTREPISIPYRIKQTYYDNNAIKCHLTSNMCKLDLVLVKDNQICNVEYCLYCEQGICLECDNNIRGILLDSTNNRCICNEEKGFQINPKLFLSKINMCICKENYSFYKDVNLCKPNTELNNGPYYQDRIDEVSSIPIYNDCTRKNGILYCGNDTFTPDPNDMCFNNNTNRYNTWFKLDNYEFKFAKIKDCIYIFHDYSLFFYSNYSDCSFDNNNIEEIKYISQCLNKSEIKSYDNYKEFLSESNEYNQRAENITIFIEKNNFNFHLVNSQKDNNYSELELNEECENILKSSYKIDNDTNLLIFKVDIKREDTISRQVEYQIYNPNPKKIYEKLDLSKCIQEENKENRRLEELTSNSSKANQTNILIPVNWSEKHLEYINELYLKNNISLFNESAPFYNDVCFKYKTPKNSDIYLEARRNKYYITDALCSSNCTLVDISISNYKVKCQCPLKIEPETPDQVIFNKKIINKVFKINGNYPNLKVLKCGAQNSYSIFFYFTFILIVVFVISFLYRTFIDKLSALKDFQKLLKEKLDEEDENLIDNDNDNDIDKNDLPHSFKPKKEEEINEHRNNEDQNEPIIRRRRIKNNISTYHKKNEEESNDDENNNTMKNIENISNDNNIINNKEEEEDISKNDNNSQNNEDSSKINNPPKVPNEDNNKNKNSLEDSQLQKNECYNITNSTKITKVSKKKKMKNIEIKQFAKDSVMALQDNKGKIEEEKNTNLISVDESNNQSNTNNLINESDNNSHGSILQVKYLDNKKEEDKKEENKNGDSHLDVDENKNLNEKHKKIKDFSESKIIDNKKDDDEKDNQVKESTIPIKPNYGKDDDVDLNLKESNEENDLFNDIILPQINYGNDKKDNQEKKNIKADKKDKNNIANPPGPKKKGSDKKYNKKENKRDNEDKEKENENDNEIYNISFNVGNQNQNYKGKVNVEDQQNGPTSKRTIKIEKKDINKKEDEIEKKQNEIETLDYFYNLNKSNFYYSKKNDIRGFFEIFFSMVKYNSTLFYPIFWGNKDKNDIYVRTSVIVLTINIHIFFNLLFVRTSSSLHLYKDRDKDLKEKFSVGCFLVNFILYPLLFYAISTIFKKIVSYREFIYNKSCTLNDIELSKEYNLKKGKKKLKIHDIQSKTSKLLNFRSGKWSFIYFGICLVFLIFNCYFVTCFTGVYNNSIDCLFLNIFMSAIFSIIFTLSIFALSALLRIMGLNKENNKYYDGSRWLNPTYVLYGYEKEKEKEKLKQN